MSLYWRELSDDELAGMVEDLEEWVDWLRRADRRFGELVQDCWPNHVAVALQLDAWREWWWSIYAPSLNVSEPGEEAVRGSGSGQQAIMFWRSLEEAQDRLTQDFRGCQRDLCRVIRDKQNSAITEERIRRRAATQAAIKELGTHELRTYLPAWSE